MRKLTLVGLALALSACVDSGAQRRAFLASLIGQPETVAVRVLGVPTRTYETGGTRFLAYDERRVDVIPVAPFFGGYYGYYGAGFGPYGAYAPEEVVVRGCETTLEVAAGVVRAWSLRGTLCG